MEEQRRKTSSGHSNSPKSKGTANHDEKFLKASIKAHDSRKYLLNNNPKSIHDRLSSLIRKKSSPINKLRIKHNSLHENSFISNTYTT